MNFSSSNLKTGLRWSKLALSLALILHGPQILAESSKETAAGEYVLEVNGIKGQMQSLATQKKNWNLKKATKIENALKQQKSTQQNELKQRAKNKIVFPAFDRNKKLSAIAPANDGDLLALLEPIVDLLLPAKAEAAASTYGTNTVDGNLADWSIFERLNLPADRPPNLASGIELYGRYVNQGTPVYLLSLKSPSVAIGANTTFWLNTDQNPQSGYQIWGSYGGAEYSINIGADGTPTLYDASLNPLAVLEYAYSADKKSLELVLPASLVASPGAIDIVGDVNDQDGQYFPDYYSSQVQFTVDSTPVTIPTRTDSSKRIAIVFSESSKKNFYNGKAYSQLYMAIQHHAMMAGIGFDLLNETDLTDLNKLVNYDAIVFPNSTNLPSALIKPIRKTLFDAVYRLGIGLITGDDFLTSDENDAPLAGNSYQIMGQLMGIERESGAGPVTLDLLANSVSHPAMKGYAANESILSSAQLPSYKSIWTSYYRPLNGQNASILANQRIGGVGDKAGVIATTTGGRNVHFATASIMADSPLLWQAIQWSVYGSETPVGLKMGRQNNLFVSRNDMDQSQEYGSSYFDNMGNVDVPLLNLLNQWKTNYNFVGSYYINIGNNPPDQQTVWLSNPVSAYDSQPLYKKYIALGNEIGTHSYSHPQDTNVLTPAQTEFEFNQSMNIIGEKLFPTWQNQNIRGAAVPGMPETVETAQEIMKYTDYLSGGGSLIGAGYPGAIGFLTPAHNKVYLSPNLSFDFTLVEFGVPNGNPPVPKKLTASEADAYWANEYARVMNHASQPIVHWPWHDYGPTCGTTAQGQGYTVAMFQNMIDRAFKNGAEFTTAADVAQRIQTFKNAKLSVSRNGNQYTANVAAGANSLGQFSLAMNLPNGQKIQNVTGWYAYNEDKVFLDQNGGSFVITTGTTQDAVTRISDLPMRSRLLSLNGDGRNLTFTFEGEGTVKLVLGDALAKFSIVSDGGIVSFGANNSVSINFSKFGTHEVRVIPSLSAANLVYNGSFEEPASNSVNQYASMIGWGGNGDTIEVGPSASYGVTGASDKQVVEVDANIAGANTGLYQAVQTEAGQSYILSVDLAMRSGTAAANNSVEIWWRGSRVSTVDPSSTAFKTYSFNVTGSGGSDVLEFREQSADNDSLGGIIDNVRLRKNLVVNGSFETPSVLTSSQYGSISGWSGIGDSIEVMKATLAGVSGATGSQVLEIDANKKGANTGLSQMIATQAGKTYNLSLDVAMRILTSSASNSVTVWWRGQKLSTITPTTTAFKKYSFTVSGSGGNDELKLLESGSDDSLGGIVDNVMLLFNN